MLKLKEVRGCSLHSISKWGCLCVCFFQDMGSSLQCFKKVKARLKKTQHKTNNYMEKSYCSVLVACFPPKQALLPDSYAIPSFLICCISVGQCGVQICVQCSRSCNCMYAYVYLNYSYLNSLGPANSEATAFLAQPVFSGKCT